MWWQGDRPRSDVERAAEIADLSRRRDAMLERAPMSAISGQLVRALILLFILFAAMRGIVVHYQSVSAWLVYGIFGVLCLIVIGSSLRFPPISDRWAMSRLVGYEGDSPQDLQARIDRLRSEQGTER